MIDARGNQIVEPMSSYNPCPIAKMSVCLLDHDSSAHDERWEPSHRLLSRRQYNNGEPAGRREEFVPY